MKSSLLSASTRVAAILSAVLPCQAQKPSEARSSIARSPEVAAALTVLDAWIATTVSQREQPGLSIGVVHDQELIWAKGYGYADLAKRLPATPVTKYRIASITKPFTATAIMQLRDAGKLRLDDAVAEKLAWFSVRGIVQGGPRVTIRQLLTHTSGLPREVAGVNWNDLTIPDRDEMRRIVPTQAMVFAPELEWKYSNLAYALAGEIVAEVSGEPWADYLARHILGPLGMTATEPLPTANLPGLAVGYGRRIPGHAREIEPFLEGRSIAPAGSIASNVEDLAKFVSLQFRDGAIRGAQVLSGSTLREMHRVQWLRPDWQSGWALGFAVRRVDEQVRVGHGGGIPGHTSYVEFAPADRLGVVVMANSGDELTLRYVDQAFRLLTPAMTKAVAPPGRSRVADVAWQQYVGRYTGKFADIEIQVLDGELAMINPSDDDPWKSRMILEPAGPHAFRMVARGFSYADIGEILTFQMDSTGKVGRVRTPYFSWLPMP